MRIVVLSLGLLAVLALAMPVAPAAAQDRDGSGEEAVLARLNEIRAQVGAGALARHPSLDVAAAQHSVEMADTDQLMHVSPRTGTPVDRVRAAGLDVQEIAENVAMHGTVSDAQAALEASDAHLANMLNPRFTHVGLAAVRDERGFFLTQVFARVEAPAPAGPPVSTPPAASEPAPAPIGPAPAASAAAPSPPAPPVAAPQASSGPSGVSGQVLTVRTAEGATLGYWVCGSGRWWYYPLPPTTTSGQHLAPDLTVTGGPPGYGACAAGPSGVVAVGGAAPMGAPTVGAPAAAYGYRLRPAPAPPPTYYAPRVVQPGSVIQPWGGGVGVGVGIGPQPYGRVILLR
jgi:hypothetical protein